MRVRQATYGDHDVCCKMMKRYEYTSAYSHIFYSSPERYARGDILVAISRRKIVGVACVSYRKRRYKGRPPAANLQYIAVETPGEGVGACLVREILGRAPNNLVELKVEEENRGAIESYARMGFEEVKRFDSDDGKRRYVLMIKRKPT